MPSPVFVSSLSVSGPGSAIHCYASGISIRCFGPGSSIRCSITENSIDCDASGETVTLCSHPPPPPSPFEKYSGRPRCSSDRRLTTLTNPKCPSSYGDVQRLKAAHRQPSQSSYAPSARSVSSAYSKSSCGSYASFGPPSSVVSAKSLSCTSSRIPHQREPQDGYCWLLFFKEKYWKQLRQQFGPNTPTYTGAPAADVRAYMCANPHMVSSRKDLKVEPSGPNLSHVSPGGRLSAWSIVNGVSGR